MDSMRLPTAKILVHSEGLGTPNPSLVRQRAQEIAQINGHSDYTEADWRQAKLELHGAHYSGKSELSDEMAAAAMVSEADMVAVDTGHHTERLALEDERNLVEELWLEGMEEAEHERMLQASRDSRAEDEAAGAESEAGD